MKKFFKVLAGIVSFFLTALSVSEAMKKKDELKSEVK